MNLFLPKIPHQFYLINTFSTLSINSFLYRNEISSQKTNLTTPTETNHNVANTQIQDIEISIDETEYYDIVKNLNNDINKEKENNRYLLRKRKGKSWKVLTMNNYTRCHMCNKICSIDSSLQCSHEDCLATYCYMCVRKNYVFFFYY